MKLYNYTGRAIAVELNGKVISSESMVTGSAIPSVRWKRTGDGKNLIQDCEVLELMNMPPRREDVVCIVSQLVAMLATDRNDLVYPDYSSQDKTTKVFKRLYRPTHKG